MRLQIGRHKSETYKLEITFQRNNKPGNTNRKKLIGEYKSEHTNQEKKNNSGNYNSEKYKSEI